MRVCIYEIVCVQIKIKLIIIFHSISFKFCKLNANDVYYFLLQGLIHKIR